MDQTTVVSRQHADEGPFFRDSSRADYTIFQCCTIYTHYEKLHIFKLKYNTQRQTTIFSSPRTTEYVV